MTASELYQAGQLNDAVAAATQAVKARPADFSARWLLCELLCFSGDVTRADLQLDLLAQQDASVLPMTSMFRHLIRAEQARQQFYADGRVPEFLDKPSEELSLRLEASIRLREKALPEAAALLEKAEALRTPVKGTCDGLAFADFRDLDDLTSSFFELLTANGKYYWIPFSRVESIEFAAPERAKDLIWRSAKINVHDGPDGQVYIAALYHGTHANADQRVRLGRATEWSEGPVIRGSGQREFLIGEEAKPIMQIGTITFG
jgi:type VI secretion system protein ImpE